jgi:hypothetical protein
MKKKLYKSVIVVEVLSEEPIESSMNLAEIVSEGDTGSFSIMSYDKSTNKEIKGIRAVREMELHGSDPAFFSMDSKGNEIED